ncbi:LLM class flavin-dependent oxidoreductase [Aquipuribacter hungaricus]|uniref:LLM class flavin-dependent oxidoreductase n=1 Tax=Aquipuribacter hungaricus TaxID=545624 RepID=A0ABV7WL76_9MICO
MTAPAAVGVMLPREVPPAEVARVARACEAAGFDEVWVVEDCFYTGGTTAAAIALAATSRVTVGIGILPAVARNPAFAAMELATLAGAFPGRVHAGIGHGVASWMEQVGAVPASWLTSIRETTDAVRDLLHGRTVTTDGDHVRLDQVALEFPPDQPPLVSLGVRGPRSVAVAGAHADGLVLAEPTPPSYVAAARARLDAAAAGSRVEGGRRITAYTWALTGDHVDPAERDAVLRERCTGAVRHGGTEAHTADLPAHVREHLQAVVDGTEELSDEALDLLAVRGDATAVRAAVAARHGAGADCVVLVPPRVDRGVDVLLEDVAALGAAVRG